MRTPMETIKIDGRTYVSHDCWTFGDYGGAGSVGLANIRALLSECEGHIMECPMSTLRYISEGCPYGLGADELVELRAERPWLIHVFGDYGSEQVWVRKPLACRLSSHGFRGETWIERMDNYPSLDDDMISQIEMEWESEAWKSWLKSDLIRSLPDDLQELAEDMSDDDLLEAYRNAMEETNTCPTPEYSGVHVDVCRIAPVFASRVEAMLLAR